MLMKAPVPSVSAFRLIMMEAPLPSVSVFRLIIARPIRMTSDPYYEPDLVDFRSSHFWVLCQSLLQRSSKQFASDSYRGATVAYQMAITLRLTP